MRERRSKLDPLSRIITLGDIECETINEIIQDIYEINEEDVNNLRGRAEERHFQEATRLEQAEMDEAASRIAGASYSLPS